jgi:CubicO group peptidase (beta-lactamase class C family)
MQLFYNTIHSRITVRLGIIARIVLLRIFIPLTLLTLLLASLVAESLSRVVGTSTDSYLRAHHSAKQSAPQQTIQKQSSSAQGHTPKYALQYASVHASQHTSVCTQDHTVEPRFQRLCNVLDSCINEQAFPSAVVCLSVKGKIVFEHAFGRYTYEHNATKATVSTIYDLASLTKVLCTTTCLMKLVSDGRVALDSTVASYIPEFAVGGKQNVTVRHLLLHNSGFVPFRPVPKTMNTDEEFLRFVLTDTIKRKPGDSTVYSDLGFLTLGELVRRVTGKRLDVYFAEHFTRPMGLSSMMFTPPDSLHQMIAPVEPDSFWVWNKPRARVHDPRAAFLSGVAGHAGLFSNARDIATLMSMLTNGGTYRGRRFIKSSVIAEFTRRAHRSSSRALGWDTRVEGERSSAGTLFSDGSFGHTGFTGTSVWYDPKRQLCAVFLTNRVYPSSENRKIMSVRPLFHTTVVECLEQQNRQR